jgi:hypothetical protein
MLALAQESLTMTEVAKGNQSRRFEPGSVSEAVLFESVIGASA